MIPKNIIEYYSSKRNLSFAESQKRFEQLEAFLKDVAENNTISPPSEVIDDAWHEFILHTEAYQQYCKRNFKMYIHHHPDFNDKGKCDAGIEAQ